MPAPSMSRTTVLVLATSSPPMDECLVGLPGVDVGRCLGPTIDPLDLWSSEYPAELLVTAGRKACGSVRAHQYRMPGGLAVSRSHDLGGGGTKRFHGSFDEVMIEIWLVAQEHRHIGALLGSLREPNSHRDVMPLRESLVENDAGTPRELHCRLDRARRLPEDDHDLVEVPCRAVHGVLQERFPLELEQLLRLPQALGCPGREHDRYDHALLRPNNRVKKRAIADPNALSASLRPETGLASMR